MWDKLLILAYFVIQTKLVVPEGITLGREGELQGFGNIEIISLDFVFCIVFVALEPQEGRDRCRGRCTGSFSSSLYPRLPPSITSHFS